MNMNDRTEAQYLLRKALTLEGADLAFSHLWIWEGDRWKELVFALLTRVASLPEDDLRDLTDHMSDLDLLDIPTLANIRKGHTSPDTGDPHARRILEFLRENGFSPEKAQGSLVAICEAALGLQEHYDGKVQRYLRSYGELMLRDLDRIFQFSTLNDTEVKYAFTYWLQNVLNMPLSLLDENVQMFCKQHDLEPKHLFAAADELDVNLALVDDVVKRYVAREVAVKEQRQEGARVDTAQEGGSPHATGS